MGMQWIVRDAHAFTQETALGLALRGVLEANMKQRPREAQSLTGDGQGLERQGGMVNVTKIHARGVRESPGRRDKMRRARSKGAWK